MRAVTAWACLAGVALLVAVLFTLVLTHTYLVPVSPWKVPF